MSWRCSSTTNEGLVTNLWRHGLIKSPVVKATLLNVDRAHFSPIMPYEDSPQRIGYDATISAPHIHANAAEALLPLLGPGKKVLDIGSGSGYLTAVFAHLVYPGLVVGIDHIQQLCDMGINNLRKDPVHAHMLNTGNIKIIKADGRLGWAECGPYDAIHVGAAATEIHQNLVDQLNSPGRMFIPVDNGFMGQHIWVVDKDKDGKVTREKQFGVMYVPLTDAKVYKDEL